MRTAFCFNLDGTVTTTEVLPCIASEIGISDEIATLTRATMDGCIAFEPALKLLCLILGQVPTDKVHAIVSNIPLDEGIFSFIHNHKADSFLVTGKLDIWVQSISGSCGCEIFSSTSIVEGDKIRLKMILNKGDAVSELRARGYDRIVAIGNSAIDVPMLIAADIAIVFGGVLSPSQLAISVSDYIIHERAALCRMLQML
jgi:phosphoserine phosphatase